MHEIPVGNIIATVIQDKLNTVIDQNKLKIINALKLKINEHQWGYSELTKVQQYTVSKPLLSLFINLLCSVIKKQ